MKTQMVIDMDDKGNVSVNGPLENKLLCYGLLEVARDAVHAYQVQAAKRIQPVSQNEFEAAKGRLALV
jgi:hypothetical protein